MTDETTTADPDDSRRAYMRDYMRQYRASAAIGDDPSTNPTFTGDDIHWQDQAACAGIDPALFFPERGDSTAAVKEVCRGCPVRQDCLDYALDHGEKYGIWGGKSERERRRIRGRRKRGEAA